MDIDAAGQTRLQWLGTHPSPETQTNMRPEARDLIVSDPLLLSDYVRPAEPEVKARLLGFLGELRRYKDLDGVALEHWSRLSGPGANVFLSDKVEAAPPLGYCLADRIAYLGAQGSDPIDMNDRFALIFVPGPEALDESYDLDRPLRPWNSFRFAQDADLANALIAEMEKGWPGRVQMFSYLKDMKEGKTPQADVTVRTGEAAKDDKVCYRLVQAPALSVDAPKPRLFGGQTGLVSSSFDPAKRLEAFKTALAASATGSLSKGIVLDFTGAPDLLWDGLALLDNMNANTVQP